MSTRNGVDGRNVWLVPLIGEISTADPTVVCDPQVDFADYVSEVELERLNLVRTSDAVLWRKLSDVGFRLAEAKANARPITLDGAGRITIDGTPVDAAPEQAAIYASVEGPNPAPPVVEDGRPVGGNRVA